jgi:arylsulfatase A-like enzyme
MTNLLLLWTDEQRADTIGACGNQQIQTPNLDRLAEQSVVCTQAYCTCPVCTPSRATILTGLYPHTHGALYNNVPLPGEVPTIAELLRPRGYICGYAGKWHLGNELRPQHGFLDSWASMEDGYIRDHIREGFSTYHQWLVSKGYAPQDVAVDGSRIFSRRAAATLPEAAGKPAFLAEQACRFLDQTNGRSFFLSVNFLEPHMPFTGPWDTLYDPKQMVLPASWYREPDASMPLRYRIRRAALHTHNPHVSSDDERGWKELVARYWGLVSLVDKYVGRILEYLEYRGLADDTLVVYTSDHGDMMGEHRLVGKGVAYEGAARVPLLLRHPTLLPKRIFTPVSQIDLVPTLFDLLGIERPEHLQGRSLRPLLERGDRDISSAEVVFEWSGGSSGETADGHRISAGEPEQHWRALLAQQRTIRRGRWKLTVDETNDHELYDLEADPQELVNLLGKRHSISTAAREAMEDLWTRLRTWQQRTADPLCLSHPMEASVDQAPEHGDSG